MDSKAAPGACRIWRSPDSDFYGDEALHAADVYTDETLKGIAGAGFNGVWLRGRLYDLMQSTLLPELEREGRPKRLASLKTVIERCRRHGIAVYLFFNEPLAPAADHQVWASHPQLRGRALDHSLAGPVISLCSSHPTTRAFMREATASVLNALPGLGGVMLITASEYPTHCWSHFARRSLSDGIVDTPGKPLDCPRCVTREPAEIVAELAGFWVEAARRIEPQPRVLVWNWSWSMWYPDPQAQVIERLPEEAVLLIDWERGGRQQRDGVEVDVDEYSLSYTGPSDRFSQAARYVRRFGREVAAKLQVGTTHELASVPNLPLIRRLHEKLCGLHRRHIPGVMACWNFGCSLTLNTEAVALFNESPEPRGEPESFMHDLARRYFGDEVDTQAVLSAWDAFVRAFDHYPLSNRLLYFSPMNYAPAYPLTADYRDEPMGWSWIDHQPWGDRVDSFLGPFSLSQVLTMFERLAEEWRLGLTAYRGALRTQHERNDERTARHCFEELSCAEMIALHARGMANILRFARWRRTAMQKQNLSGPCRIAPDPEAKQIMAAQLQVMEEARVLVEDDPRLGYHQECHAYLCGAERLRLGIERMHEALSHA